ncbi:hypothetical protein K491DRAFT_782420 [Lophiostoma macrostomum CBS 122681]|uniref:Cora-domain-containing protein n=1 Tax=Lophiostoma macrostomum CBS 122681 TaxID=1314788 RepID=A0A6A6SSS1_9PLEO|nr:hypothetical protein K491DRAFT_782420 [Lophiostoma macrostomum CBS 122681]
MTAPLQPNSTPSRTSTSTLVSSDGVSTRACAMCEVWTKTGQNRTFRGLFSAANLRNAHFDHSQLTVIFAKADAIRECGQCRADFVQAFEIPEVWWTSWSRRSNGYFGSERNVDQKGDLQSYQTWFRFLVKHVDTKSLPASLGHNTAKNYAWYKQNIFTHWVARTRQTFVIIFDPHEAIGSPLKDSMLDSFPETAASHPFEAHTYLLQELVSFQDKAVWSIRDLVRGTETKRSSYRLKASYFRLHEVARHAIHVSETLSVAVSTLGTMMHEHDYFFRDYPPPDVASNTSYTRSRARLSFIRNTLKSLLERSNSNKDRLANEIQLSFNNLTLFNSNTSIKIGHAAQIDSATLKTIAFLTLTFLPATFVSGMFSMSFFGFSPDEDRWAMSKQFWIYWAIAVPVTLTTLLVWHYWDNFFPVKSVDRDDE